VSNEAISFGCCENFTNDGTFLGWETKTFTKTLIGHIIAEEVAEAGMEVAGLDSFLGRHRLEILVREEDSAGVKRRGLESRGGKLEDFGLVHPIADTHSFIRQDDDKSGCLVSFVRYPLGNFQGAAGGSLGSPSGVHPMSISFAASRSFLYISYAS
jgi:hypothetical protein